MEEVNLLRLHDMQILSEILAKRWMPGLRHAAPGRPKREAWRHPEDLVVLIDEWPASEPVEGWGTLRGPYLVRYLKSVAWLHDLIEDGRKEDKTRVTAQDLLWAGLLPEIVIDVQHLTHGDDEDKGLALARLKTATYTSKVAKCFDRICNLREGAVDFKEGRWGRYVVQTETYILPLAEELDPWFVTELRKGVALRPVVSV